jgi:hypothetical protein
LLVGYPALAPGLVWAFYSRLYLVLVVVLATWNIPSGYAGYFLRSRLFGAGVYTTAPASSWSLLATPPLAAGVPALLGLPRAVIFRARLRGELPVLTLAGRSSSPPRAQHADRRRTGRDAERAPIPKLAPAFGQLLPMRPPALPLFSFPMPFITRASEPVCSPSPTTRRWPR